jgi:thiamine-monophosphate kinase
VLDRLYSDARKSIKPSDWRGHLFPQPRIEVGKVLRDKSIATAMIDISDGLSTDLSHICEESSVGAEVSADAIPRASVAGRKVDLQIALHGGEAYELLFTAKGGTQVPARIAGAPITCIGEIVRRKNLVLVRADRARSKLRVHGWQHFQHSSADK